MSIFSFSFFYHVHIHGRGMSMDMVKKLKEKIKKIRTETQERKKKLTPFTYFSPMIRKVTNIFKDTDIKVAYRATNTIFKQLTKKPDRPNNPNGIYSIKCITCNKKYVGQSSRDKQIGYKEHINQIKNCNPQSAYANHIIQNKHEFGSAETTLKLLKQCNKGSHINCWEQKYIQEYHRLGKLITE